MPPTDWAKIFAFSVSPVEMIVRGSVMYLVLFAGLRLALKRTSASFGLSDLLLIVLIAEASQNALAGNYTSVPDGLVLVATLIFWNHALDALGYRFKAFGKLVHPPPLLLVRDGKPQKKAMRKELITMEELMSSLREAGVATLDAVESAYMEGDGEISVVRKHRE